MANGYYSEKNRKRIIYEQVKRHKQALRIKRIFIFSVLLLFAIFIFAFIVNKVISNNRGTKEVAEVGPVNVIEDFLDPNIYSRPQTPLKKVKGIVIHYTANPGSDAIANRNYFNNLPSMNEGSEHPVYASSHYVIGLDGTIVQCIPLMRFRMHPTTEIRIRYQLNAVIPTKQASLPMKHITRLSG